MYNGTRALMRDSDANYARAAEDAEQAIRCEVRCLIRDRADLIGYTKGMGTHFFEDAFGELVDADDLPELEEFWDMVNKFDDNFKILGEPWRLLPDGTEETDW